MVRKRLTYLTLFILFYQHCTVKYHPLLPFSQRSTSTFVSLILMALHHNYHNYTDWLNQVVKQSGITEQYTNKKVHLMNIMFPRNYSNSLYQLLKSGLPLFDNSSKFQVSHVVSRSNQPFSGQLYIVTSLLSSQHEHGMTIFSRNNFLKFNVKLKNARFHIFLETISGLEM